MKPLVFAAPQDDAKEADCRSPGRRHAHSFIRDRTSRMNPIEIDEFKYPKLYPYSPFEVDPKTVLQWLVEAADQALGAPVELDATGVLVGDDLGEERGAEAAGRGRAGERGPQETN